MTMTSAKRLSSSVVALMTVVGSMSFGAKAWGYGEDFPGDDHSTAHYDVTLALARCAGLTAADSKAIAEANQVTDTLAFGATAFTFTDRAGPQKMNFHFPEPGGTLDGSGDGSLKTWAYGTSTLTDGAGTLSICDAAGKCCGSDGSCVEKGSLAAVGIWLHAVGDYWSHHACSQAGGSNHTTFNIASAEQAAYCPPTMHSHEWGARETSGFNATLQANALKGLQTMREVVGVYASSRGKSSCGTISDADLLAFASGMTSTIRRDAVLALYTTCDTAAACITTPTGGDTTGGTESAGCGCSSAIASDTLIGLLVAGCVGLVLARRRRPRT
jgi:hypothetical protein